MISKFRKFWKYSKEIYKEGWNEAANARILPVLAKGQMTGEDLVHASGVRWSRLKEILPRMEEEGLIISRASPNQNDPKMRIYQKKPL